MDISKSHESQTAPLSTEEQLKRLYQELDAPNATARTGDSPVNDPGLVEHNISCLQLLVNHEITVLKHPPGSQEFKDSLKDVAVALREYHIEQDNEGGFIETGPHATALRLVHYHINNAATGPDKETRLDQLRSLAETLQTCHVRLKHSADQEKERLAREEKIRGEIAPFHELVKQIEKRHSTEDIEQAGEVLLNQLQAKLSQLTGEAPAPEDLYYTEDEQGKPELVNEYPFIRDYSTFEEDGTLVIAAPLNTLHMRIQEVLDDQAASAEKLEMIILMLQEMRGKAAVANDAKEDALLAIIDGAPESFVGV